MQMIASDVVTDEEQRFQRLLDVHPALKDHMTLLINTYRSQVQLCIELMQAGETDSADVACALAKQDMALVRIGLPILETPGEWVEFREQQMKRQQEREASLQEDYTTWSIGKFCRLIERLREQWHMAANHKTERVYRQLLDPVEAAFQQLHPRAYRNWEKRYKESFQ